MGECDVCFGLEQHVGETNFFFEKRHLGQDILRLIVPDTSHCIPTWGHMKRAYEGGHTKVAGMPHVMSHPTQRAHKRGT